MSSTIDKIDARSKSVREILDKVKYTIDYYQREYNWKTKQIADLLDDLSKKFLENYKPGDDRSRVRNYPHYFLGSIIISEREGSKLIVDGQQRLTSLTLLLIYLNNLQQDHRDKVDVSTLIFSEQYGSKSFNLNVPEISKCIDALYHGQSTDKMLGTALVNNVVSRYGDIEKKFPDELNGEALPYFIDWVTENVKIVEIITNSDKEAYTIFETMNDRGLNLGPTDLLKGYLLSNIDDHTDRVKANQLWKERSDELTAVRKDEEATFFKVWLRAKYARAIREGNSSIENDFDKIGNSFHKWVRDEKNHLGLRKSPNFREFVLKHFNHFATCYIRIQNASGNLTSGLEYLFYNSFILFPLAFPLMLAPIGTEDNQDIIDRKIRAVADYIDIVNARYIVNGRTPGMAPSTSTSEIFKLLVKIRNYDIRDLIFLLKKNIDEMPEAFDSTPLLALRQLGPFRQNIHYLLARITYHIEHQCGIDSTFEQYMEIHPIKGYQIEHIWANHFAEHADEFGTPEEFNRHRNLLGNLVLLPNKTNQSLNDSNYEKKVEIYFSQNLLARSLHKHCYQNNPLFLEYIKQTKHPFKPYQTFKKDDIISRQELYQRICEEIWNPARLDKHLV